MHRRSLVLLLALSSTALAAGCGGGDSANSAPTVATSPSTNSAEFAKRVDAICARGRLQGLRYQPPSDGQSEQEAMPQEIETTLLPAIQDTIDRIAAAGSPAGGKSQVQALVNSLQQAVNAAEELDEPNFKRIEHLLAPSGRLAHRDGFEACVYSG